MGNLNIQLGNTRPTVLIVDDERAITDTLAAIFEIRGFTALRAYSGEMAVLLARKSPPDFAIFDIVMDGISGIEAAVRIRALCPACQLVLLTGAEASADLLAAASEQGHTFKVLVKPIHPELLLAEVVGSDGHEPAAVLDGRTAGLGFPHR